MNRRTHVRTGRNTLLSCRHSTSCSASGSCPRSGCLSARLSCSASPGPRSSTPPAKPGRGRAPITVSNPGFTPLATAAHASRSSLPPMSESSGGRANPADARSLSLCDWYQRTDGPLPFAQSAHPPRRIASGADRSTKGKAIKPLESTPHLPLFFFLARQGERAPPTRADIHPALPIKIPTATSTPPSTYIPAPKICHNCPYKDLTPTKSTVP